MKAIDRRFPQIINGAMQFVIPVFQRDYSWTETQCEQLWKDVIRVAGDGGGPGHFLGSIVYVPTGDTSAGFVRWLLIDGQQRLTTLMLLLIALRDQMQEDKWEGDNDDSPTVDKIEDYFLRNSHEKGTRQHKLVLRNHDQETLQALLEKKDSPAKVSERLRDNYEYFRERLTEADPDEVYRGIGRLVVVDVTLDRGSDDPQLVFESLNSTGMDLSQADLIRNFILMRLPEDRQTQLYSDYWRKIEDLFRGSDKVFDAFVRDFLALKTQANKQQKASEIYQAFRDYFREWVRDDESLEAGLGEMLRYARYYSAFAVGRLYSVGLDDALTHLRRLVDVPAVLVMRLFDCFERAGSLSEREFREALELLESYVFRRAICGHQTRGYWSIFANLAYGITDQDPLTSLRVGLARQRESYRFPSDGEFGRELAERDLYSLRVCKHLLDRLENHGSKESSDTALYTIEHIMPQSENLPPAWRQMLGEDWRAIQETWLHRLGNLTLTGYNSSYSDRPFEEKKKIPGGFEDSAVRLNKYLREQAAWTVPQMKARGEALASKAMKIWPKLEVAAELIEEAQQRELKELASRRDVGRVKMSDKARALFTDLSARVKELGEDVVELAEAKSVSYHRRAFFLEILPRKHRLTLLLPLDFSEIDDPTGIAEDATEWKFFFYAKYEGGVSLRVKQPVDIESALPMIRQAYSMANG